MVHSIDKRQPPEMKIGIMSTDMFHNAFWGIVGGGIGKLQFNI